MKRLILILILTFSFQTLIKANDISEFEIEGMSIGDSALNFFSKEQLDQKSYLLGTDDKYLTSYFYDVKFEIYDGVEVSYLKKDSDYIIQGISGGVTVKDINECKRKKNDIAQSLASFFFEAESLEDEGSTPVDKTGKSKFFRTSFQINPKSKYFEIETSCIFYYGDAATKFTSNAGVTIKTDKMNDWLHNEAYR
tara:strand:+ start:139 stop:723 length:585 start_codon:yes stop_codon:yes gene_type:complete